MALKNCVKLPSPDAEPDAPGDENPLALGAADGSGVGMGVSCGGRAGGTYDGGTPETKIFVNSPEGESADGGAGVLTPWVGISDGACLAGAGAEGRGPSELNIEVNSPGPDP